MKRENRKGEHIVADHASTWMVAAESGSAECMPPSAPCSSPSMLRTCVAEGEGAATDCIRIPRYCQLQRNNYRGRARQLERQLTIPMLTGRLYSSFLIISGGKYD